MDDKYSLLLLKNVINNHLDPLSDSSDTGATLGFPLGGAAVGASVDCGASLLPELKHRKISVLLIF